MGKTTKTTLPYKEIHSFFSYFCNVTHENEKKKKEYIHIPYIYLSINSKLQFLLLDLKICVDAEPG